MWLCPCTCVCGWHPTLLSQGQMLGVKFPDPSLARLPCFSLAPAPGHAFFLRQNSGLLLPSLPRMLSFSGSSGGTALRELRLL